MTTPAIIPFKHQLSAHCESGVTSALMRHAGMPVTEPLAFGIGSGLFFVRLPLERQLGPRATSFRSLPGTIFSKACKRLGVRYETRRYRDPREADEDLVRLLSRGVLVGAQTSVYWLTYLPARLRFPFNMHNLLIHGRSEQGWKVADPAIDVAVDCPEDSMRRARFASGPFAPRGKIYFLAEQPKVEEAALRRAVLEGARETATRMSRLPLPWLGWRAIRLLSRHIERWPTRGADPKDVVLRLANVVRVQEEVGTGGAGFRYLYAAFLQEAGALLGDPAWADFSARLTEIGDRWRQFAVGAARICKSGQVEPEAFREVAAIVADCAERERAFFVAFRQHLDGEVGLAPTVAAPSA